MDDALVQALRTLEADPDVPLLGHSDPERGPVAPVWIWLRSGCADLAAELHSRFGDRLDLKVGFLPFPPGRSGHDLPARDDLPLPGDPPAPPSWLTVRPAEPVVIIPLDRDSSRVPIRLSNDSVHDVAIVTGDAAMGHVLDPQTCQIVGGTAGVTNLIARTFELLAGETLDLPAVFGPASMRADLGYQLPAGDWLGCVDFALHVGPLDGTRTEVRSRPFPVRIG